MRILYCNIAYLKYYDGRVTGEYTPVSGGAWVKENQDAHEKWNFLNMEGHCYGFVQVGGGQIHIEKLEKVRSRQEEADDLTVVWCAAHPTRGTVIVGWYEHATVYRFEQEMMRTPLTGLERFYWFKAKAEDAYLLPESDRTFVIGRASRDGTGKGFGQSNVWFAQSKYAKDNIIPATLAFIEDNREKRVNVLTKKFLPPEPMKPLSKEEERKFKELGDDENLEYLSYSYRKFHYDQSADNAYGIAVSLLRLHQYKMALPWYEKTIELDPDDLQTKETIVYLYQQCEEFKKSKALALELLKHYAEDDPSSRDELYCVIADNCFYEEDIDEGIKWLDKLLNESSDTELIEYTKKTRRIWAKIIGKL